MATVERLPQSGDRPRARYSYRTASMGCRRAALKAGWLPNTIPTSDAVRNARSTAMNDTCVLYPA